MLKADQRQTAYEDVKLVSISIQFSFGVKYMNFIHVAMIANSSREAFESWRRAVQQHRLETRSRTVQYTTLAVYGQKQRMIGITLIVLAMTSII